LMWNWIMRMPEPMPLGLTFLLAIVRAMVLASLVKMPLEPVLKLIDSTKNATAPSWWIQGGRSRSDGKQDAVSQRRDGRTMADC
jgi:hypothetical protein